MSHKCINAHETPQQGLALYFKEFSICRLTYDSFKIISVYGYQEQQHAGRIHKIIIFLFYINIKKSSLPFSRATQYFQELLSSLYSFIKVDFTSPVLINNQIFLCLFLISNFKIKFNVKSISKLHVPSQRPLCIFLG